MSCILSTLRLSGVKLEENEVVDGDLFDLLLYNSYMSKGVECFKVARNEFMFTRYQ